MSVSRRAVLSGLTTAGTIFVMRSRRAHAADASGRVVLYNPSGAKLGEQFVAAFGKLHPDITVDVINSGVGELFTRIKAEKSRPQGDVLLGSSIEAYQSDPDLFEPYKTADDAAYPRTVVGPN